MEENTDAESKRLSQIMERLKVRNFPSTNMKQGVRVQVAFQDRRNTTDIDRDVIVERINRQSLRGKIVHGPSTVPSTVPKETMDEIPPTDVIAPPATKKLKKLRILEPTKEELGRETEEEEPVQGTEEPIQGTEEPVQGTEEPVQGMEEIEETKGTKKSIKVRVTKKKSTMVKFVPPETPKEIVKMVTSPYYMSNRKRFLETINQLFEPFMKELSEKQTQISCNSLKSMGAAGEEVVLLIHQRVAREYLNLYSPYRGLLLYYGLGSGKSLASITIAEGMKSHKKICVLTPASLKMNFFTELKRAGDPLYKKNQNWAFVSTDGQPDLEAILSKKLSLSLEFIRKKKGAWLAEDESTSPNKFGDARAVPFSELSEEDQKTVDKQLDQMIRAKYLDINYNGINHRLMSELTENYTQNPFDNSVVIIDEVHNLVNMIVNQVGRLSKKSTHVATKIGSTTPISLLLYEYIMQANNARVVFLSGTPIINTPNEIAVMFNMLRGYIKTWSFQLQITTNAKITTETILQMFQKEKFLLLDYVEYSQNKLTITRNPFGFINNSTGKCNSNAKTQPPPTISISQTRSVTKLPAELVVEGHTERRPSEQRKIPSSAKTVAPENLVSTVIPEKLTMKTNVTKKIPKTPVEKGKRSTKKIMPKEKETETSDTFDKGLKASSLQTLKVASLLRSEEKFATPNTMVVENDEDTYNMDPHEGGNLMYGGEDVDPNYRGVCLDETGNMDDSKFIAKVKDILKRNGLQVVVSPKVELFKCLPDRMDDFLDMFIDMDTGMMKQSDMFSRRILGLTSFFKSPQENLLPSLVETAAGESYELVKTEMSSYQFEQYAVIRKEERDKDANVQKTKKKRGAPSGAEGEGLYREMTSTYRIYSRSCCNFAWPDPPGRPISSSKFEKKKLLKNLPEEEEEVIESEKEIVEEIEKPFSQKERPLGSKKTRKTPSVEFLKSTLSEKENDEMTEKPFSQKEKPLGSEKTQTSEEEEPPKVPKSSMKSFKKEEQEEEEKQEEEEEQEEEEDQEEKLKKGGANTEEVDAEDMGEKQEKDDEDEVSDIQAEEAMKQLNQEAYLALANLSTYSPKFAAITENILSEKNSGLHLVYSSFRTLEGIGILQLVLENNGFRRFNIKRMADGEWDMDDEMEGIHNGGPTYALYTGTESTEEKEIIRNIYNGAWDIVPPRIAKKLESQDKSGKKNVMGDVIRVLMITASGAEGINLKNTRFVHIVEPYWNMVRVDQVVGRARRICSHEELPPELRTVKVFLYLSVFSEKQKTDQNYVDLMNSDVSRLNENQSVTTDETLYEISLQKQNISKQILNVVKASSMDCALYQSQGSKESLCYGANLGNIKTNDFLSYPTLNQDAQVQNKQVITKQRVTFREITIKGKKYHLNESNMEIFEHDDYIVNKKNPEVMNPIGKLVKEGKGYKIQQ